MFNSKSTATKSSQQVDLDLYNEIVVLTLESFVRLFFNHDDNVSSLRVGRLITFAMESDCLTTLHTLVDVDLQELLLLQCLLALAL